MEVEMKAKISTKDLESLLTKEDFGFCKTNEIREFFIKKDTYYSFNGEKIKKPKNVVRIRDEKYIDTWNPGQVKPLRLHSMDGVKRDDEYSNISIMNYAALEFFNFNIKNFEAENEQTVLTIKEKHTDKKGIESNVERESEVFSTDGVEAFLEMTNFKKYFEKEKRSISFYTVVDNCHLHLEIVSVNASELYLEIECITEPGCVVTCQNAIKKFFKEALNIEEFDGRSWAEIIGE